MTMSRETFVVEMRTRSRKMGNFNYYYNSTFVTCEPKTNIHQNKKILIIKKEMICQFGSKPSLLYFECNNIWWNLRASMNEIDVFQCMAFSTVFWSMPFCFHFFFLSFQDHTSRVTFSNPYKDHKSRTSKVKIVSNKHNMHFVISKNILKSEKHLIDDDS